LLPPPPLLPLLLLQVKQAELDLGDAKRSNASLCNDKRRIDQNIEQLQLETDSAARALKVAIADKENQLVDHDVLKLQVCGGCGLLCVLCPFPAVLADGR
jgi:hypothetical protein